MPKQYRHTPKGLALYLGAECEYTTTLDEAGDPPARDVLKAVDLVPNPHIHFTLILRPLNSMTKEEKRLLFSLGAPFTTHSNDVARGKGFDIGGPCESSEDGKEWKPDWVESFIEVGLAKSQKTKL